MASKTRHVKVLNSSDGQFYYVVTNSQGEPVYTSETYTRKNNAVSAARLEHQGRTHFQYLLEWHDGRRNRDVVEVL